MSNVETEVDTPSTDNLFALFEDSPEWQEAEREIKQACDHAAAEIVALQERYAKTGTGVGDTDSSEAINRYLTAKVNGSDTSGEWFRKERYWYACGGAARFPTWEDARASAVALGLIKQA